MFRLCVRSLNYPAYNAYAQYYIVICGLSSSTKFSPIIINGGTFEKKN
jgi:hypothetical protein